MAVAKRKSLDLFGKKYIEIIYRLRDVNIKHKI